VNGTNYTATNNNTAVEKAELIHLKSEAAAIKGYLEKNNFNTDYCFMIDMSIAPGKKRFFIFDLNKDSIEKAGLVAHGSGSDKGGRLVFSNIPESKCSSLG